MKQYNFYSMNIAERNSGIIYSSMEKRLGWKKTYIHIQNALIHKNFKSNIVSIVNNFNSASYVDSSIQWKFYFIKSWRSNNASSNLNLLKWVISTCSSEWVSETHRTCSRNTSLFQERKEKKWLIVARQMALKLFRQKLKMKQLTSTQLTQRI